MRIFADLKISIEKLRLQKKERFLWVFIFLLFLGLRIYGVGSDISNSDAARWHRRSLNFLQAVKTGNFKETYQHYQPGVTLMLLNAPLKQTATSFQRYILNQTPKTLENADYYPVIHGLSKVQINLVLAALLVFQVFIISKLFSKRAALAYFLLISAEPYLVGIDRWFHLTSMETYFSFSALLSLIYWAKVEKPKFLYLSSVFFSLAVLSKLTSLILGPVLLAILVTNTYKERKFMPILKYGIIFVLTSFLIFPALWVSPFEVFQKLYDAIFNAVSHDSRSRFFNSVLKWVYYPVILGFKLSPITLILFFISLFGFKYNSREYKASTRWILVGFLNYLLFLTVSSKKIDRYSLVFFPYVILLISIFISSFELRNFKAVLAASLGYSLIIYVLYSPVNSAYYSPLFGGSSGALNFGIYENSGEYFAQAAKYLNIRGRDNRGRDKIVWVPNNIESFSYFFKGNILRDYAESADYIVSSVDIDRKSPIINSSCTFIEKGFGDFYRDLVYVLRCDDYYAEDF